MAVRRSPYKDFLQPALQRRFSLTAAVLLAIAYIQALCLADWSSFLWAWFPLGPTGIRSLIIFGCGLPVLVLRIANYHVGLRTTDSSLQTLQFSLATTRTYETAFWYLFSSLAYATIFLWTSSAPANLQWITYYSGDRARLNERPLFLTCYMFVLAVAQTILHYYLDLDRLEMGGKLAKDGGTSKSPKELSTYLKEATSQLPTMLSACAVRALLVLPLTLAFYVGVIRSLMWSWTMAGFRLFYNMPRSNVAPHSWPLSLSLMSLCFVTGLLATCLWSFGNLAFSAFMAQEPLKDGKPLTSESKDPNGSLLNGLKSKKPSVQTFALWELAHISQSFDAQRKAIYEDIDRKDGSAWSQIFAVCMELLRGMEARIDDYGKPPVAPQAEPQALPKQRITAPPRDDPIMISKGRPASAGFPMKGGISQTSPGPSPLQRLSPLAKRTWREAKDRVMTKEQQEAIAPEHIKTRLEQSALKLAAMDGVGALVRQDFRLKIASVVLGYPYAETTVYCNAATALCQLSVNSLKEDNYGNVHRDVPNIIRTLTMLIRKVESFKTKLPLHWADSKSERKCPEVDQVLNAFRDGLRQVVAGFEPYSSDLRLTLGDLRQAKEASAKLVDEEAERKQKLQQKKGGEGGREADGKPVAEGNGKAAVENSDAAEMEEIRKVMGRIRSSK